MPKSSLTDRQMSDAAYIDQAAKWSKDLARLKARGPGDLENAMRQIEAEYGVDYWTQWTLRYRRHRLKIISISIYVRLRAAYQAECQRQMRRMQHEIDITEKVTGPDCAAVRAAKALAREGEG